MILHKSYGGWQYLINVGVFPVYYIMEKLTMKKTYKFGHSMICCMYLYGYDGTKNIWERIPDALFFGVMYFSVRIT